MKIDQEFDKKNIYKMKNKELGITLKKKIQLYKKKLTANTYKVQTYTYNLGEMIQVLKIKVFLLI